MPSQNEKLTHPDNVEAVTPHDSNNLSNNGILYVGGAGDVALVTTNGNSVTFSGVQAGSFLPVQVRRVNATNTTATNILVLY